MNASNAYTISFDEFVERFLPIKNESNPDGPMKGFLFRLNEDDLHEVREHPPDKVWTLVQDEMGLIYILNGYHFGNRKGHVLTDMPADSEMVMVEVFSMRQAYAMAEEELINTCKIEQSERNLLSVHHPYLGSILKNVPLRPGARYPFMLFELTFFGIVKINNGHFIFSVSRDTNRVERKVTDIKVQ